MRKLSDRIDKRNTDHVELERAETRLIQKAFCNSKRSCSKPGVPLAVSGAALATTYVAASEREMITLPLASWMPRLPFLGTKMDKISHLRRQLALNRWIAQEQRNLESYSLRNSAILKFNSHFFAQAVAHSTVSTRPDQMLIHYLGMSPAQILWSNLGRSWWEMQLREILVFMTSSLLVLGWSIPIAFTGLLSRLSYLAPLLSWSSWLDRVPVWSLGILQGVLPQACLWIIMICFPLLLRIVVQQQKSFTKAALELSLQKYYFAFLFIHLMLVVSISLGIVPVLAELLNSTKSGPTIIPENLLKASNSEQLRGQLLGPMIRPTVINYQPQRRLHACKGSVSSGLERLPLTTQRWLEGKNQSVDGRQRGS